MPAATAQNLKKWNEENPDQETFVATVQSSDNLTVYFCDKNGREIPPEESKRPHGKINATSVDPDDGECRNAYKIKLTTHTLSGWGPMLYDCILNLAANRGITPDRMSITPAAVNIWNTYFNQRKGDVSTKPLDINGSLTPNDKSDDCISSHETLGSFENPQLKNPEILKVVNQVYYDSGIKTLPELKNLNLIYSGKTSAFTSLWELYDEFLLEVGFNKKLLKKMGYKYLGRNKRIGSDTFIHAKDDNSSSYHKKLTKRINKNLNKGGYYRSKKHDTLKDPPAMGVSWTKGEKG